MDRLKQGKLMRGYEIRARRAGEFGQVHRHGWAAPDELPIEWEQIKAEPGIIYAEIFYATQRARRPGKRRIIESWSPQEQEKQGGQWDIQEHV